jgi:hypothetical protein
MIVITCYVCLPSRKEIMRTDMACPPYRWLLHLLLTAMLFGAPWVSALEVGEPAPDFTLLSTTGKPIRLSQFQGNKHVLIQFYSMDFNPS